MIETATIPEIGFLLGLLAISMWITFEYQHHQQGLPIYLFGVSIFIVILWAIGLVSYDISLLTIMVDVAFVMLIVMVNEVNL